MSSRTNLKSLTDLNFTSEVYESDVPVVVEFFADWCVSCKSLFPILDELAKEYGDKVKICTVNIEKAPAVSQECQIMGVPKIVVVNNGAVVAMFAGFRDNIKSILSGRIEELLYS
ncbi:MAG: thioredoxin domain-containing protein [bacterium]|jgi:thioredoxin 1|nr:thioredoxin domain-containing protein [bacterium]